MEGWISVNDRLPKNGQKVKCFDTDSMTPEKELLFEDGCFCYKKYGSRLDYTDFISHWQPITQSLRL